MQELIPLVARYRVLERRGEAKREAVTASLKSLADRVIEAQTFVAGVSAKLTKERLEVARQRIAEAAEKSVNRLSPSEEKSARNTEAYKQAEALAPHAFLASDFSWIRGEGTGALVVQHLRLTATKLEAIA